MSKKMTYIELIDQLKEKAIGKLTPHESAVYTYMLENGWLEPHYEINDLTGINGLTNKQLRGVLSSLSKKGYVVCETNDINMVDVDCIYIVVDGSILSFPCDHYPYE